MISIPKNENKSKRKQVLLQEDRITKKHYLTYDRTNDGTYDNIHGEIHDKIQSNQKTF